MHYLRQNRRQRDPDERKALESLRDGDIDEAVSWYVGQGRVHAVPNRDEALQGAADAWAADVAAGHDTRLYAWRRAHVAELNWRARAWTEASRLLSGPELACPGGAGYRAGDRVVTLAPPTGAGLVTSERATVESVDLATGSLLLRTDDGLQVRLSGEEAAADRLALGYATTVHRAHGSTTSRAHLFADGGGRELAYVAMSRARETTHTWAVADDMGQAADDLRRDWSVRTTPTWAIDTGLPGLAGATREAVAALPVHGKARFVALALAQAKAGADAVQRLQPGGRAEELAAARAALRRAEQDLSDLQAGNGTYAGSEPGRAVSDLARARAASTRVKWSVEQGERWRERRAAAKESAAEAAHLSDAEGRWQAYVGPEEARLEDAIYQARRDVEGIVASQERPAARWWALAERGHAAGRVAQRSAVGLAGYREVLDGDKSHRPKHGRGPVQPAPSVAPVYVRPPVGQDLGPDL